MKNSILKMLIKKPQFLVACFFSILIMGCPDKPKETSTIPDDVKKASNALGGNQALDGIAKLMEGLKQKEKELLCKSPASIGVVTEIGKLIDEVKKNPQDYIEKPSLTSSSNEVSEVIVSLNKCMGDKSAFYSLLNEVNDLIQKEGDFTSIQAEIERKIALAKDLINSPKTLGPRNSQEYVSQVIEKSIADLKSDFVDKNENDQRKLLSSMEGNLTDAAGLKVFLAKILVKEGEKSSKGMVILNYPDHFKNTLGLFFFHNLKFEDSESPREIPEKYLKRIPGEKSSNTTSAFKGLTNTKQEAYEARIDSSSGDQIVGVVNKLIDKIDSTVLGNLAGLSGVKISKTEVIFKRKMKDDLIQLVEQLSKNTKEKEKAFLLTNRWNVENLLTRGEGREKYIAKMKEEWKQLSTNNKAGLAELEKILNELVSKIDEVYKYSPHEQANAVKEAIKKAEKSK